MKQEWIILNCICLIFWLLSLHRFHASHPDRSSFLAVSVYKMPQHILKYYADDKFLSHPEIYQASGLSTIPRV